MQEYFLTMHALGVRLSGLLSAGLGLEPSFFEGCTSEMAHALRLLHYSAEVWVGLLFRVVFDFFAPLFLVVGRSIHGICCKTFHVVCMHLSFSLLIYRWCSATRAFTAPRQVHAYDAYSLLYACLCHLDPTGWSTLRF